jgi:hypothetical protein
MVSHIIMQHAKCLHMFAVFFVETEGNETFGDVKLGGLDCASVAQATDDADLYLPPSMDSHYHPPVC